MPTFGFRMLVLTAALVFSSVASAFGDSERVLAIVDCTVFDPQAETLLPHRTILVRGPLIESVTGPDQFVEIPPDAVQIDGRGKFALPGLIDAHVHLVHLSNFARVTGDELLPLFLAAGVTSVRSTGDEIVAATLVARFAERHSESSPRVFTCSPLLDADPPIHRDVGRAVTDPVQVPALLDDLQKWNVTTLKIYAGTKREVGLALVPGDRERHWRPDPAEESAAHDTRPVYWRALPAIGTGLLVGLAMLGISVYAFDLYGATFFFGTPAGRLGDADTELAGRSRKLTCARARPRESGSCSLNPSPGTLDAARSRLTAAVACGRSSDCT